MAFQIHAVSSQCLSSSPRIMKNAKQNASSLPTLLYISSRRTIRPAVRSSADSSSSGGRWDFLKHIPAPFPCLSDVLWPSAGAFAAMALLGRLDRFVAHKGVSFTIAPIGSVCAVLFAAPTSPAAQKYNMFVAQIGCAAIGVLALSIFGPGWLARATALAACIAFMTVTGAIHPPAASLPILFIDGAKFHHLSLWYALFPGATGCLLICLIQEMREDGRPASPAIMPRVGHWVEAVKAILNAREAYQQENCSYGECITEKKNENGWLMNCVNYVGVSVISSIRMK